MSDLASGMSEYSSYIQQTTERAALLVDTSTLIMRGLLALYLRLRLRTN